MKITIPFLLTVCMGFSGLQAQEHYAGLATSNRVGLLNANINPAELVNLSNRFELNLMGFSANVMNNKIGLSDIFSDKGLDKVLFQGSDAVNFRVDSEINWPGIAFRVHKWGFGIGARSFIKFNVIDADVHIGDAVSLSDLNNAINGIPTTVQTNYNQRLNGTVWSEMNLSASRVVFEKGDHRLSAGGTLKLLFPGSYANIGVDQFKGTFVRESSTVYLYNAHGLMNFSYSGNLAGDFNNSNDYTKSTFGGLNGVAADFGVNYRWKNKDSRNYRLKAGFSVRNMGAMTFKDDNNKNTTYALNIPNATPGFKGLDMNQFNNAKSLIEVEQQLLNSGYLTKVDSEKNFRVNLPAVINLYVDYRIFRVLYCSAFMQQKLNDDSQNAQITAQNIYTLTPRLQLGYFELYTPFTQNEIYGFKAGLGLRLGGFYIGSNSALSMSGSSKQGDIYFGMRWGFLK
jgi:hypothetical protein